MMTYSGNEMRRGFQPRIMLLLRIYIVERIWVGYCYTAYVVLDNLYPGGWFGRQFMMTYSGDDEKGCQPTIMLATHLHCA